MDEEIFEKIVEELVGTTGSLDTVAEEYGMDIFFTDGLTEYVDDRIFCCTACGWWCPQDEEASEEFDLDEWTCHDCASLDR